MVMMVVMIVPVFVASAVHDAEVSKFEVVMGAELIC
jgi:hypothetical protein